MGAFVVRKMVKKDRQAVKDLILATAKQKPDEDKGFISHGNPIEYANNVASSESSKLVCELDGQIVGVLSYSATDSFYTMISTLSFSKNSLHSALQKLPHESLYIWLICTHPDFRGMGVASALYARLSEIASKGKYGLSASIVHEPMNRVSVLFHNAQGLSLFTEYKNSFKRGLYFKSAESVRNTVISQAVAIRG